MFIKSLDSQPVKPRDSLSVGRTDPGISIFKKFQLLLKSGPLGGWVTPENQKNSGINPSD